MGLTRIGTIISNFMEPTAPTPIMVKVPVLVLERAVGFQFQNQLPLSPEQLHTGWKNIERYFTNAPTSTIHDKLRFLAAANVVAEIALVVTDRTDADGFIVMRKGIFNNLIKAQRDIHDIEKAYKAIAGNKPGNKFLVVSAQGHDKIEPPTYIVRAISDFSKGIWSLGASVHAQHSMALRGHRGFSIG